MIAPPSVSSSEAQTPAPIAPSNNQQNLEQAAQAFEAIFVRSMIGAMRQASFGDDLTGNNGSDQFRDMMDARIADEMTHANGPQSKGPQIKGLGIADLLIAQWKDRL